MAAKNKPFSFRVFRKNFNKKFGGLLGHKARKKKDFDLSAEELAPPDVFDTEELDISSGCASPIFNVENQRADSPIPVSGFLQLDSEGEVAVVSDSEALSVFTASERSSSCLSQEELTTFEKGRQILSPEEQSVSECGSSDLSQGENSASAENSINLSHETFPESEKSSHLSSLEESEEECSGEDNFPSGSIQTVIDLNNSHDLQVRRALGKPDEEHNESGESHTSVPIETSGDSNRHKHGVSVDKQESPVLKKKPVSKLSRKFYKSLENLLGGRKKKKLPLVLREPDQRDQGSQSLDENLSDFEGVGTFSESRLSRAQSGEVASIPQESNSLNGSDVSNPKSLRIFQPSDDGLDSSGAPASYSRSTPNLIKSPQYQSQQIPQLLTEPDKDVTQGLSSVPIRYIFERGSSRRRSRQSRRMMSGWSSLSGHLSYRAGGVLLRLKGTRRLWWTLKDSQSILLGYRSREEASRKKEPLTEIELMGAGITLNPKEKNQFVIITEGKEHFFTAENHESLMVWLLGLQARRDARARLEYEKTEQEAEDSEEEFEVVEFPGEGGLTKHPGTGDGQVRSFTTSTLDLYAASRRGQEERYTRRNVADSVDAGLDLIYRDNATSYEDINAAFGRTNDGRNEFGSATMSCYNSTGNELDYDNVFSCPEGGDMFTTSRDRNSSSTSDGVACFNSASFMASRGSRGPTDFHGTVSPDAVMRKAVTHSASSDSQGDVMQQLYEMEQQLIATKQEMAKLMNRETCFREILSRKDNVILELDERLTDLEHNPNRKGLDNKLKEEVRELQNQKRFLNEEIRRLVNLRHTEQSRIAHQNNEIDDLKLEVEQSKRDYVFLLQSCITVPTGDIVDGMEVNLFGGNIHKERIKQLLNEAREINPSLPTYNQLCDSDVHIDQYGFKHQYKKEGLLLHYICQQLHLHYLHNLSSYEQHQRRWADLLRRSGTSLPPTKELKLLGRGGVPPRYRQEVWHKLVYSQVQDLIQEKGPNYYSHLVNMAYESQDAGQYRKQIMLDLLRTMPHNVSFGRKEAEGIRRMREVLQAFAMHNPDIGYCQGLNFIVGMSLLILETEDAFWMLVAITEKYFAPNYFDHSLTGALADQEVLQDIMKDKLPTISKHLHEMDIDVSTVTLNWFLAVFFDAVPFETLLRLWDCFLIEGPKILFRVSLAILKSNEGGLLCKKDTISIMKHLKCCSRLIYDANGLLKTAFEELKPFPRRRDIAAKQVVYVNALKDKLKKKDLSKRSLVHSDFYRTDAQRIPATSMLYECAIECSPGVIWMSLGDQHTGRICVMTCHEGLARSLNIPLEARVMTMCTLESELCIAGTLSGGLLALSVNTRRELWRCHLKDNVLSLCCAVSDQTNMVYAGLGDGSVAVLQQVQPKEPQDEPVYIQIGRSPVTSLLKIGSQLWAGSGNVIHIMNASTLDPINRLTVTPSILDHVLAMVHQPGQGVWITIKGSSVVELWDETTLTCKLLYDVKHFKPVPENKFEFPKEWDYWDYYSEIFQEEDFKLNKNRITAILPYDDYLWLGTGDGTLLIFQISPKNKSDATEKQNNDVPSKNHVISNAVVHDNKPPFKYSSAVDLDEVVKKVSQLHIERSRDLQDSTDESESSDAILNEPDNTHAQGGVSHHPMRKQLTKQMEIDETSGTAETSTKSDSPCNGQTQTEKIESNISVYNKEATMNEKEYCCESPMPDFRRQVYAKTVLKPVESLVTGRSVSANPVDASEMRERVEEQREENTRRILKSRKFNTTLPRTQPRSRSQHNSSETDLVQYHEATKSDLSEWNRRSSEEGPEQTRNKSLSLGCINEVYHRPHRLNHVNRKLRAYMRVPQVNVPDSSTSQSLDSDNESRDSTPVTIPRSPRYEEQNSTPLQNNDCYGDNWTSLGPWDTMPGNDRSYRSPGSHGTKRFRARNSRSRSPGKERVTRSVDSYPVDLILHAKIKVADRPIRCLVKSRCGSDTVVISCAGCSGDDEAVLMWKRGADNMWSNEPMTEVCPYTNAPQRPSYVRTRSLLRSRTMSTAKSDEG